RSGAGNLFVAPNPLPRPQAPFPPPFFSLLTPAHDCEALFGAVAVLLVTAVWRLRADRPPRIDPNIAGLKGLSCTHCAADVPRDDRSRQAVWAIVCKRERLTFLLEGQHRKNRTEDFLACDLHRVLHLIEYRRADEMD